MNPNFEVFIPIAMFAGIAIVTKIITDYKLRAKIIEKGNINENIKFLLNRNNPFDSLTLFCK